MFRKPDTIIEPFKSWEGFSKFLKDNGYSCGSEIYLKSIHKDVPQEQKFTLCVLLADFYLHPDQWYLMSEEGLLFEIPIMEEE